jgi:hypothetical protein
MREPKPVTADQAIEVLNRLFEADPTAISTLIKHRVPCNKKLADDPTCQVAAYDHPHSTILTLPDGYSVAMIGVINALFGVDDKGCGFIAYEIDKPTGEIKKFHRFVQRGDNDERDPG